MRDTLAFRKSEMAYWSTPAAAKITGNWPTSSDRLEQALIAWEEAKNAEEE